MQDRILAGQAARDWIDNQLAQHEGGVAAVLAPYRSDSAVAAWHEALRGVEEFINVLRCGLADGPALDWLLACPIGDNILTDPARMNTIMAIVGDSYDGQVAHRLRRALVQAAEINTRIQNRNFGHRSGINFNIEIQIYLLSDKYVTDTFEGIYCWQQAPLSRRFCLPSF